MRGGASGGPLAVALERVARELEPVGVALKEEGLAWCRWEGKLIRPLVGYAAATAEQRGDRRLWLALAAVQLAHEASLLHDDIIDGADHRRGVPTVAASRGVGAALVQGDHLLTTSYRLAARTGSLEWAELFARAVERTVAGEKQQARSAGQELDWDGYRALVVGKSGELLGAALAAGPLLRGDGTGADHFELGRRIGLVYQMLDDLLDYCPHADTGKPALADYRRGLWTWPRLELELSEDLSPVEIWRLMLHPSADGTSPLDRCTDRLRREVADATAVAAELMPGERLVAELLADWLHRAERLRPAERRRSPEPVALPPVAGWEELMAEHARSFRFASRLFPSDQREQVVGVYGWCRYTDDLVDGVDLPADQLEARLDAWLVLSRRAYGGEATGNALADRVMGEMREAGVPFGYAEELIAGMRMDIRGEQYGTLVELWKYTYRVASVVGLWMTELFGIRDPWMLDRAASLGHAMQLTNILRDVGEDLEAGRLYLPHAWLSGHGLSVEDLHAMRRSGEVTDEYRALVERLIEVADREYEHAAPAIARLPDFYRRPVAVAADVYRGIHDAIRANGYDNLTRRAYTSLGDKLRLGAGALWRSRKREREERPRVARAAALGLAAVACMAVAPAPGDAAPASGVAVRVDTPDVPAVVAPHRPAAGRADSTATARALAWIGELWVRGVDEERAVAVGLREVERLRQRVDPRDDELTRMLDAYQGALLALRAKHGTWPPSRLRDVREGFRLMDGAVERAPDHAAPRYIRLMSGFHLPGFFGRGDEVQADLSALAELLPHSRDQFPEQLFPEVVGFILEHGEPTPEQRAALEALLP